jgi:hypothetical protein
LACWLLGPQRRGIVRRGVRGARRPIPHDFVECGVVQPREPLLLTRLLLTGLLFGGLRRGGGDQEARVAMRALTRPTLHARRAVELMSVGTKEHERMVGGMRAARLRVRCVLVRRCRAGGILGLARSRDDEPGLAPGALAGLADATLRRRLRMSIRSEEFDLFSSVARADCPDRPARSTRGVTGSPGRFLKGGDPSATLMRAIPVYPGGAGKRRTKL